MSANGIAQIVFYLAVLTALTPPLGAYMARVFEGRRIPGSRGCSGRWSAAPTACCASTRRASRPGRPTPRAVLAFSVASFALLYAILRLQGHLPLNPNDYPG